jgi:hypothetical protein
MLKELYNKAVRNNIFKGSLKDFYFYVKNINLCYSNDFPCNLIDKMNYVNYRIDNILIWKDDSDLRMLAYV